MKQLQHLIIMSLIFSFQFGFTTTYQQLSIEELFIKAELVFYGVVISVEPVTQNEELWTQVEFELLEGFKGFEDAAALELLFYGGTPLDGPALQVSLMPQFNVGETVLILAYMGEFYSPIVGFRQGLWREQNGIFIDELGRRLSLGEEGELALDGAGASPEDIFNALRSALEAQE